MDVVATVVLFFLQSLDFTNDPQAVCSHVADVLTTGDTYPAFGVYAVLHVRE